MVMDGKSIMEVIVETAEDASIDKVTLHKIKALAVADITAKDYTPRKIKKIREKACMSQAVFAMALNIKPTSIRKWERGESKPSGAALKLLSIVEKKGIEVLLP